MLNRFAQDASAWQERAALCDYEAFASLWGRVLATAYGKTLPLSGDPRAQLQATAALEVLRVRVTGGAVIAQVLDFAEAPAARAARIHLEDRIAGEQRRFKDAAHDDEKARATPDDRFPLATSLLPARMGLALIRLNMQAGRMGVEAAAEGVARFAAEGTKLIEEHQAWASGPPPGPEVPLSLPALRERFEALVRAIEISDVARAVDFDAEGARGMLQVIEKLQGHPTLREDQLISYRQQLQVHYDELADAFARLTSAPAPLGAQDGANPFP